MQRFAVGGALACCVVVLFSASEGMLPGFKGPHRQHRSWQAARAPSWGVEWFNSRSPSDDQERHEPQPESRLRGSWSEMGARGEQGQSASRPVSHGRGAAASEHNDTKNAVKRAELASERASLRQREQEQLINAKVASNIERPVVRQARNASLDKAESKEMLAFWETMASRGLVCRSARCDTGLCDQSGCIRPICDGGGCIQVDTFEPACGGGHCDQANSTRPECAGGLCLQFNTVEPRCPGGACVTVKTVV